MTWTIAKLALTALKFLLWAGRLLERRGVIREAQKEILDKWAIENAKQIIRRHELDDQVAGMSDTELDDFLRSRGSKK